MNTAQGDYMICRLSQVEITLIFILVIKSFLMFHYFLENLKTIMLQLKWQVIMFKLNKFIKISQIIFKGKA
jgi:hypothetical protein